MTRALHSTLLTLAGLVWSVMAIAAEPPGTAWLQMTGAERIALLTGYQLGVDEWCLRTYPDGDDTYTTCFFDNSGARYDKMQRAVAMTDLYANSANKYVPIALMHHLIIDRISGKNIDQSLVKLRSAFAPHEK
jgi:hypothetical protein